MHAPETVGGGQDRILSGEGHRGPCLRAGEADVRQQRVERIERVEPGGCVRGRRRCGGDGPGRHAGSPRRARVGPRWCGGTEKCWSNAVTARGPRSDGARIRPRRRSGLDVAALGDGDDHAGQLVDGQGGDAVPTAPAPRSPARRARRGPAPRARRGVRATSGRRMAWSENSMETSVHCRSTARSADSAWSASGPSGARASCVARGHGSPDPRSPPLPTAVEQREEQGVLVGEVGVEGPLGQAGPRADLGYRGRPVALLGEQLHGGIEQGGDRARPALRDPSWHTPVYRILNGMQYRTE